MGSLIGRAIGEINGGGMAADKIRPALASTCAIGYDAIG
jgi:hypothetical protein